MKFTNQKIVITILTILILILSVFIIIDAQNRNQQTKQSDGEVLFIKNKQTHTAGLAYSKCPLAFMTPSFLPEGMITENYIYYDTAGMIDSKNTIQTLDGELISYSLANEKRDNANYYSFYGGDYAIQDRRTKTEEEFETLNQEILRAISNNKSNTENTYTSERIRDYFARDVIIEGKILKDGKEFYQIAYEDVYNCETGESENGNKIIYKDLLEASNLSSHESKRYLNSVSEENLIGTILYEYYESFESLTLEEFNRLFSFNLNVPIKTITPSSISFYDLNESRRSSMTADFLEKILPNIEIPYFENSLFRSISSNNLESYTLQEIDPSSQLQYAREFFPQGELGDEMHKSFQQLERNLFQSREPTYIAEIMAISYVLNISNQIIDAYINMYDKNVFTLQQLIDQYKSESTSVLNEQIVKIMLNEEIQDAILVTWNNENGTFHTLYMENQSFIYQVNFHLLEEYFKNNEHLIINTKNTTNNADEIREDLLNGFTYVPQVDSVESE